MATHDVTDASEETEEGGEGRQRKRSEEEEQEEEGRREKRAREDRGLSLPRYLKSPGDVDKQNRRRAKLHSPHSFDL